MRSRALRVTLTLLAVAALGGAAWFAWTIEAREVSRRAAASAFSESLGRAQRAVYEVRAAQQAYVAPGQSETYWFDKVTSLSEALRKALGELDVLATSAAVRESLGETTAALREFEGADRRARSYAATGQDLLASDIIFGDGVAAAVALARGLDAAGGRAAEAGAAAARDARREQLLYAGGGVLAMLIVLMMLTPTPRTAAALQPVEPAAVAGPGATLDLKLRNLEPQAAPVKRPGPEAAAARASKTAPAPAASPLAAPPAAQPPGIELQTLAAVCTDLAKLADTDPLPGILERTARALGASGLVLWVADFEGTELVPVATHGYPASVLSRLGTIKRDAENATGAAFRTGLVQTVGATGSTSGAIAAPLVTPSGCRGVMSAEVRGGGEKEPAKLAAAAIVAAQLSGLVGPPPAAAAEQREAAL
jgi:hypothetical protein